MKKIIFFILCFLPLSVSAKLKDSCNYDGRNYVENVKVKTIFGYQGIIDPKYPSLGGVEIKETKDKGKSYTAIISDDDYYLFNSMKTSYMMDKNINICLTKDRPEYPFPHLLGMEMN